MRRLAPLLALAVLLLAPASASAVVVGIADQKPDMFADPRFAAAELEHVRIQVGWDVMTSPWQRAELDAWLTAARAAGARPLVSFGHSRERRRQLPTPERLLHEFRRVRRQWPWVREYATWNEANHCGQPTCNRPALVAAYWRKLRRECAGDCRVLAAELLDMPNMLRWTRSFRRAADVEPRLWGLHNYVDANRFRTRSLRQLLGAVRGQVWLTETGGLVKRRGKVRSTVRLTESTRHAGRVTRFLLREVPGVSPRVRRIYLYHWNMELRPGWKWDSGLFGPDGRARPAWTELRRHLAAER